MGKPRWIETEQQKQKAEKVLSMLEHKIRKGTATVEDRERYRRGCEDLAIYDWGTDSYQSHVPNQKRAQEYRKREAEGVGVIARLPEPELPDHLDITPRPPLRRRAGRFAV